MKILLVHNYYGSAAPSGENTAYIAERELLKQHGHTVIEFTRHSDEIRDQGAFGVLRGAFATPWNPFSKRALRFVLEKEKPDVMHVHNTFPLLSPSIFHATKGLATATVFTLHNYRIFCAAGIPMHDDLPCTECLERRTVFPALKYGCYRNSRASTLPLATMIALHRKLETWSNYIDAVITLTKFQNDKIEDAGLSRELLHIKPHFHPNPPSQIAWEARESKIIFIGRLGIEKGVHVLIDAWKRWGKEAPLLEIIGDGPEKINLVRSVRGNGIEEKVTFAGQMPLFEVQRRLSGARLLILPSICFEAFPMAIPEAFALGVPVAASRLGSMPFIIVDGENGAMFTPGDAADLQRIVRNLWSNPRRLSEMGRAARMEFEKKYTSDKNYATLMEIYQAAIEKRKRRKS